MWNRAKPALIVCSLGSDSLFLCEIKPCFAADHLHSFTMTEKLEFPIGHIHLIKDY